jgi:single-stranded-DNA-specific exonuclease
MPKHSTVHAPLLKKLLDRRGLSDPETADLFLNPNYERDIHDPFLMKDMDRAVDRVMSAIESNKGGQAGEKQEKIVIYSDYDADGIPGAVVLHDFFKKIGFTNFENYIPDRHEEGFGVNLDAVETIAAGGATLIITIDCGITDVLPITRAKELGIDTIITDHHEPNGDIPPAYAILNPKQSDCAYPFKFLCGAGVIYKFVQAMIRKNAERDLAQRWPVTPGWEKWLLDMVGLATLSDMVPLTGENRVFAYYGLTVLRKSPRLGLMKLLRETRTNQRMMTEDDIGFTVTPRINAASRMGVPHDAFELLATSDEIRAGELVSHLNKINDERKGLVAAITKEVRQTISTREKEGRLREVIVMGHTHWRPTVLGLVANSLKDDHDRPVFMWGKDGGPMIKGSCRSDGRVSVVDLMDASRHLFIHFGGHKMSGGFAIEQEKLHVLEDALSDTYKKIITDASAQGLIASSLETVEDELSVDDISWGTYDVIEKMAPYGVGNPKPVFLVKQVRVTKAKPFGQTKNHMEISFENSVGDSFNAISFFTKANDPLKLLKPGDVINLKATLEKSFFKRYPELRLRIIGVCE